MVLANPLKSYIFTEKSEVQHESISGDDDTFPFGHILGSPFLKYKLNTGRSTFHVNIISIIVDYK